MKGLFNIKFVFGILFFALAVFYFVFGYYAERARVEPKGDNAYEEKGDLISATINDAGILLEIADSQEERVLGLSGRSGLPPGRGLLFIYDKAGYHGIWMKDMNFAIDIIWLDEDREVVHIKENALPENFPEAYYPNAPAVYVLEVNTEYVEKTGLEIGNRLDFSTED